MFDKFFEKNSGLESGSNMSYKDCAIEGFCSLDPIVYSLMEVWLYELKQITYYYIKMRELGYENKKLKNQIINYLSVALIGNEFNRQEFEDLIYKIHTEKEAVKESYTAVCDKENIDCQILKSNINFKKFNLSSIVNQGEQQAILRNKILNSDVKNIYEIILNLIKSASIRLVELKSYTEDYVPEEDAILKLFNSLNFSAIQEAKLLRKINDFAKINFQIHEKIHLLKEQYYGKISLNEVRFGADKGKSVLVSGQNLKELENLLVALQGTDINVYTHNGLIVAHAYPKFKNFSNLKGHYQISLDNVQYDFTSFKGPILVIGNFQYLLDRLYRGRIFTTNLIGDKGMTRIKDYDFSKLIQTAQQSEGYEDNRFITTAKVGYNENEIMQKIDEIIGKIKNKEIKHLIVIGLLNHAPLHSEYFSKMIQELKDDYFVISTVMTAKKDNVLGFDSFFNSSLIYKILTHIKKHIDFEKFPVSVFITTCNLHTMSHLFNLRYLGVKNIYLPVCTANILTPKMLDFLKIKFNVKQVSSNPQKDLKTL